MKKMLIIVLLFVQAAQAQQNAPAGQNELKIIDEITGYIKRRSLYKDSMNWNEFNRDIAAVEPGKYHPDSLMIPYILTLYRHLRKAGDNHSFYFGPKFTGSLRATNDTIELPSVTLLDEHTGYIKVPHILSFNKDDVRKYADTLRARIRELDTRYTIKGWIVDLRNNGGGTMWPMIAGLNPLLEDGTAGYFIDAQNRADEWKTLGKHPESVGRLTVNYKCKNPNHKIAVLMNGKTGSSGEMTAISFLGLPNVKTFGEPSGGYTTANHTIPLSNGGYLLLATKFTADRNKKVYKGKLQPDVFTSEQETLEKARRWILE